MIVPRARNPDRVLDSIVSTRYRGLGTPIAIDAVYSYLESDQGKE
jgi:hypothetical protein